MHSCSTTEGWLLLHGGVLSHIYLELGKDFPKNLMTEEFIVLSYLLHLCDTEPNTAFTETK